MKFRKSILVKIILLIISCICLMVIKDGVDKTLFGIINIGMCFKLFSALLGYLILDEVTDYFMEMMIRKRKGRN